MFCLRPIKLQDAGRAFERLREASKGFEGLGARTLSTARKVSDRVERQLGPVNYLARRFGLDMPKCELESKLDGFCSKCPQNFEQTCGPTNSFTNPNRIRAGRVCHLRLATRDSRLALTTGDLKGELQRNSWPMQQLSPSPIHHSKLDGESIRLRRQISSLL